MRQSEATNSGSTAAADPNEDLNPPGKRGTILWFTLGANMSWAGPNMEELRNPPQTPGFENITLFQWERSLSTPVPF